MTGLVPCTILKSLLVVQSEIPTRVGARTMADGRGNLSWYGNGFVFLFASFEKVVLGSTVVFFGNARPAPLPLGPDSRFSSTFLSLFLFLSLSRSLSQSLYLPLSLCHVLRSTITCGQTCATYM